MPLREDATNLGDSKQNAMKRLLSMEKRFIRNPELEHQYQDFMDDYLSLGHMTKLEDDGNNDGCTPVYYLPHHAVLKSSSSTTKLRVVFDASCKSDSGKSLNDIQRVGPLIQQDLFSIVVRYRQHKFVIASDIAKMYRQVLLRGDQRNLQRILWRPSPDHPVSTYRLNTVTYGLSSASFLAIRCLHQIAKENSDQYPEASKVIMRDFYVDDLLTGADTVSQARQLKSDIDVLLRASGFCLRKWKTNNKDILDASDHVEEPATCQIGESLKTLGLIWDSGEDIIRYLVQMDNCDQKPTKRSILSIISQIYDPLGLVGPSIIQAKILLQRLWRLKLEWDESVPLDIHTYWREYTAQLPQLNDIRIPRHVVGEHPDTIEIHGFCDASEAAYGACLYVRSTMTDGSSLIRLMCAKSKVAPVRSVSLPKLELCGAVLLVRLIHKVLQISTFQVSQIYCWSDSMVALTWILGEPAFWKTFVANRVAEIQDLGKGFIWRHVASEDNPADVISRGISPAQLGGQRLWWTGPEWLLLPTLQWPLTDVIVSTGVPESKRQQVALLATVTLDSSIFERFSSWTRLRRVVAYCLRFTRGRIGESSGGLALSTSELNRATNLLLRLAHRQMYQQEYLDLSTGVEVSRNSKLISLRPFLDENGVIRVGGRLRHANLSREQKYPAILPPKHPLTRLIVRHTHYALLHAGPQLLLATMREQFWPIGGKTAIRDILRKCIVCFRFRPVSTDAGPLNVKVSRNVVKKAYICIFVCFATKAIHIELAVDLSTQAFLNALKRFIARRGKPSKIWSDNGTNFAGAAHELNTLSKLLASGEFNAKFDEFCSSDSIQWSFIPARSPHFGGLWEAAVKSAKAHLYKTLLGTSLSFEELYTVLVTIEACLNSRPLTPLSNDPTDLNPLTPAHFLIDGPLTAIPEPDFEEISSNRLSRYQYLMQLRQGFWNRWKSEYLSQLQARGKWNVSQARQVRTGSMVILKDENIPPLKWRMGRIIETTVGPDGLVRVLTIRTANGITTRALNKVCILPDETDD